MDSGATAGNPYVAGWLEELPPLTSARARAREVGVTPVAAEVGALLRTLAQLVRAKTVVETGTGTGVSGLWLLTGMTADAVLTSIDNEPEHQRLAREALTEAGVPTSRSRLITGDALDVLPRLTDGGYDLVLLDTPLTEQAAQLTAAATLVRPGGVLVLHGVLRGGRAAELAHRDADSVAQREVLGAVKEQYGERASLFPLGDGVLTVTPAPARAAR